MNIFHNNKSATYLSIALCGLGFLALPCSAQPNVCDPTIEKLSGSGDLAYKFVGPQCEGTYANLTSATPDLQLVALTQSFPKVDFHTVSALNLEWASPTPADVRLRITSTRYKYYYQMDAHPGRTGNSFAWNTVLVRKTDLSTQELGLLAWTPSTLAGKPQTVYLPLKVRNDISPSSSAPLVLTLIPSVQLDEVYKKVTRIHGANEKPLSGGPLNLGYYPAHKPISIPIGSAADGGFLRVDISASPHEGGAPISESYVIYVAPTP